MILKAMRVLIMLKLQLKDTEYALESKLIDLLTLKSISVVKKKIESEDKTMHDNFYSSLKAEIKVKVKLMMCFNQSMLQLNQTYKNL